MALLPTADWMRDPDTGRMAIFDRYYYELELKWNAALSNRMILCRKGDKSTSITLCFVEFSNAYTDASFVAKHDGGYIWCKSQRLAAHIRAKVENSFQNHGFHVSWGKPVPHGDEPEDELVPVSFVVSWDA